MINNACAMEIKKDDENNNDLRLSGSCSVDSFQSPPNSWSEAISSYYTTATTSMGSLLTTVTIKGSDDVAFTKLGYPITDKNAQVELERDLKNYSRYYTLKKQLFAVQANYTNEKVREEYNILDSFMVRRKGFIDRAAASLANRFDGLLLARHCLKYHDHDAVMSAPTKSTMSVFILAKKKDQREATLSFSEQLKELIEINKSDEKKREEARIAEELRLAQEKERLAQEKEAARVAKEKEDARIKEEARLAQEKEDEKKRATKK